jgi:adenine deaminase
MTPTASSDPLSLLARRIRVAQGQEPGDLVLTGGQVIDVFTRRARPANVVLADGWIAGVGPHDWPARQTLAIPGRFVAPGFIDSHMHLESTLLAPAELARVVLPHGTTATISDSHEIGNVLGLPGIEMLLRASAGLPLDLFLTASSCVPATSWEHAGAVLGPAEVGRMLDWPRVRALAEVMDSPAVLACDRGMLAKLQAALDRGKGLDGHTPGLVGLPLQGYVAAGMRSDHESSTVEEARAKAALGMLIQVREGSSALNLNTLLPLLAAGDLGDDWCLVTDDIFPDDLSKRGHIDGLLRRVIAAGVGADDAIRHATLIPARHYGLTDRGAVAPGYRADLVVLEDLTQLRPTLVLKDGRIVAREGAFVADMQPPPLPHANSVHLAPVDASAFRLAVADSACPVIRIVPGQIVTQAGSETVQRDNGHYAFDPQRDVALIASIERHRASGQMAVGLVSGFKFRRHGALGSSVAHDSHNLIVAGTNGRDMLACVRALAASGGGFVAASDGEVRASLPLPVAGLLSVEPAEVVCHQLAEVYAAAHALGCDLASPFGTLSFLALPVIPELRITDQGMFDVVRQRFVHA